MKIDVYKIPPEGCAIEEALTGANLDLAADMCALRGLLHAKAFVYKITNTVTVDLTLLAKMECLCSRCLSNFDIDLKKNFKTSYPVSKNDVTIDLSQDIREEIMLDFPLKPLCRPDCKGICVKCGGNLNEGRCSC